MNIKRYVGLISLVIVFIFSVLTNTIAIAGDLKVIGHRGPAGLMPENTLAGFKKAMELGVDAIELDIHLTSDSEAVIYHDSRLNPSITKNSEGKWIKDKHLIRELTLSEVQSYDVGKLNRWSAYSQKYRDQKPVEDERIPTLRDVIKLVKRTNDQTNLFIELKHSPIKPEETKSPEEISGVVAKIIMVENIADRVTVISFDWTILVHFQSVMPDVPTGYVTIAKKGAVTLSKRISLALHRGWPG